MQITGLTLAKNYTAFGDVSRTVGTGSSRYGYTGEQTWGGIYLRARYYDPYLNRFLSPNTIIQDPYNPLDWDRYSYTRNNPVNYTDPTGYDVDCGIGEGSPDGPGCKTRVMIEKRVEYFNSEAKRCNANPGSENCPDVAGLAGLALFVVGLPEVPSILQTVGEGTLALAAKCTADPVCLMILNSQLGINNPGTKFSPQSGITPAGSSGSPITPDLGRKLDYLFGKASGDPHNIERSQEMLRQLESIGLRDNPATRDYVQQHLTNALQVTTNIVKVQDNGRFVRESLLMGPYGGLKLQSVWDGVKLITVMIYSGR